jgi:hypothetical protein
MKMKDLRLFPVVLMVFFILTACGNSDSENSVEIYKTNVDYYYKQTYTNTGDNIYRKSDCIKKDNISTTIDGKTTHEIDESCELPDEAKGEYSTYEIIKINEDGMTILFKDFDNDYKIETNWKYETSFIEGSKKDFLKGKEVKLKTLPSDIKKFEKAQSKAMVYILGNKGFDVEKSTFEFNTESTNILISKDKIIIEEFGKCSAKMWMDAELKEALKNK